MPCHQGYLCHFTPFIHLNPIYPPNQHTPDPNFPNPDLPLQNCPGSSNPEHQRRRRSHRKLLWLRRRRPSCVVSVNLTSSTSIIHRRRPSLYSELATAWPRPSCVSCLFALLIFVYSSLILSCQCLVSQLFVVM